MYTIRTALITVLVTYAHALLTTERFISALAESK
jgi:hypothetical protein